MVRYCGGLYLVSVVLLWKSWEVLGDGGVVGHDLEERRDRGARGAHFDLVVCRDGDERAGEAVGKKARGEDGGKGQTLKLWDFFFFWVTDM
jgi:hypothetical protein